MKNRSGLKKGIALGISIFVMAAVPAYAASMDEESVAEDEKIWQGWTEENRENAWNAYAMTNWSDMDDLLNFGTGDSSARAEINETLRKKLEADIEAYLTSEQVINLYENGSLGSYAPTCYKELLLAIAGNLNEGISDPGDDMFHINEYFNADQEIHSREDSIRYLFTYLIRCENTYNRSHPGAVDHYVSDEKLAAVVQSLLYGSDFAVNYEAYNEENAKEYYERHKEEFIFSGKQYDFASRILDDYTAVKAIGHLTNYQSTVSDH
ncbi:MAG: hypothetical protein ACI39W_05410 [Brotaphodocola sp.]